MRRSIEECDIVLIIYIYGSIHDWGTTFGTKELRTTSMSHWTSACIMIYYYLNNKCQIKK